MRLPGTEDWTFDDVQALIAFERGYADDATRLLAEFYEASFGSEASKFAFRRPTDAIFARGKAAELAFATGDVALGFEICSDIVAKDYPSTPMQVAYFAAVGSVIRAIQVHLFPNGAEIRGLDLAHSRLPISWPQDDFDFAAALMRLLLPAVAASGGLRDVIPLSGWGDIKSQTMEKFTASLEFRALFGGADYLPQRSTAVIAMETQYSAYVSMMRRDQHHWKLMQSEGPIIDWPLLCIWVALSRYERAFNPDEIPVSNADADFIRSLAREITVMADGSRPSAPRL